MAFIKSSWLALCCVVSASLFLACLAQADSQDRHILGKGPEKVSFKGFFPTNTAPDAQKDVTFFVGVKHTNVADMEERFWKVSDPRSSEYGKHISSQEIYDLYGPRDASVKAVEEWIKSFPVKEYSFTKHKEFVKVKANVETAAKMLQTTFTNFQHEQTGRVVSRIGGEFSIPKHLSEHVDFVSGLTRFPPNSRKHISPYFRSDDVNTNLRNIQSTSNTGPVVVGMYAGNQQLRLTILVKCLNSNFSNSTNLCTDQGQDKIKGFNIVLSPELYDPISYQITNFQTALVNTLLPNNNTFVHVVAASINIDVAVDVNYVGVSVNVTTLFSDTQLSDTYTVPVNAYMSSYTTNQVIADYYGTNFLTGKNANNKQSVAEFLEQYYSPSDLSSYFSLSGLANADAEKVIGPNHIENPGGEASLDIQYIMGVGLNVSTWFWSVASLATDDTEPFPVWLAEMANYTGDDMPKVHSVSYGDVEHPDWQEDEANRVNVEFMKAGLRGLSIVFSSGDDGVGNAKARDDPEKYCTPFTPAFPASSPYVTVVGATQWSTKATQQCSQLGQGRAQFSRYTCTAVREIACSSSTGGVITSGGGFSYYFTTPDYQKEHVNKFFNISKAAGNLPPDTYYNTTGRGFPDVATIGFNFLVVLNGSSIPVHGTSASAPTFAAMISLLNDIRMSNSAPALGFLNPYLYQMSQNHSDVFNDIVMGDNRCTASPGSASAPNCCEHGFYAVPGWDPLTGLGSPRFDLLRRYDANLYPRPVVSSSHSQLWILVGIFILCIVVMAVVLGYSIHKINRFMNPERRPLNS